MERKKSESSMDQAGKDMSPVQKKLMKKGGRSWLFFLVQRFTRQIFSWNPLGPTIYKRLFQLNDSQSLHRKWLEITKHPFFNGCLGFQV